MKISSILFLLLFYINLGFSQTEKLSHKEKITNYIENYYKQDRENIHLHLNKNLYLTNETIWFKGYIIEKKDRKLYSQTTNVFISLYDEHKNKIKTQLVYAINGIIIGQLKLNENYKSGTYFLHVYTNYMNNFIEDESSLFKINILNTSNKISKNKKNTDDNISIEYLVEGGKLLYNSNNSIVVHIKNCLNKNLKINNIKVLNAKNEIVTVFSTNQEGYGKFELINTLNENYKIVIQNGITKTEKTLKKPEIEGINIKANNYSLEDKTVFNIITNPSTLTKVNNKTLTLIIQKNNLVNYIDFKFEDMPKKELVINKEALFKGINIIRLIDQDLNLYSERIIFNPNTKNSNFTINKKTVKGDSLVIAGNLENRVGNFSVSTLPFKSLSNNLNNSIKSSLIFNNYLKIKLDNPSYYFNDFNRRRQYELDLFLIQNTLKTNWNSIIEGNTNNKYTFDIGLEIEGKVNQIIKNRGETKIRLFSINNVNILSEINDQNEFNFKNILAVDSTNFHFTLLKKEEKLQNLNVYSIIKNNDSKFNKEIEILKPNCSENLFKEDTDINNFFFPSLQKAIILDSINVTGIKKEKMNFESQYSNKMAKGYKISENENSSFNDLLSFISFHGYDVNNQQGNVVIYSRVRKSFTGSRSPAIFMDNAPVYDFNLLTNIPMSDIDEVYIDRNGFGMGTDGMNGSIRIYQKTQSRNALSKDYVKSKTLLIKNGFQESLKYINPKYVEHKSNAFQQYATLNWIPNFYTNENGDFEITIPHYNQNKMKMKIEGIDNQGDLYDEIIEIEIE